VRLPVAYLRQIGAKEGDQLQGRLGVDGALNLRATKWSRKSIAKELVDATSAPPRGTSVILQLRYEARY
jgi:antitoxin component of MazEF toxin-antitoxin module